MGVKFLFFYAHPDDESVAAGGTIRRLCEYGDSVRVVLATPGQAGKVDESVQKELERWGSVERLREVETKKALSRLGVDDYEILNFVDGEITNAQTWGALESSFIDEIEAYEPEVVVSFDHSGWYYHLDHVAVSVASMRAVQRSGHEVQALLFNLFRPPDLEKKWDYEYSKLFPATHRVDITGVLEHKIAAIEAHASQGISGLVEHLEQGRLDEEYFQLVRATDAGKELVAGHPVFEKSE